MKAVSRETVLTADKFTEPTDHPIDFFPRKGRTGLR